MGESFWPDLQGWVWILIQTLAAGGIAWRALKNVIDRKVAEVEQRVISQINGMSGSRLKPAELNIEKLDAKISRQEVTVDRWMEGMQKDVRLFAERLARLEERTSTQRRR